MTPAEDFNLRLVQLIVTTVLTVVGAAFGTWVALQQLWTSKDKIKLDLYDRRYNFYADLVKHIDTILMDEVKLERNPTELELFQDMPPVIITNQQAKFKEAVFLFGEDVSTWANQVVRMMNDYMVTRARIVMTSSQRDSGRYRKAVADHSDAAKRLHDYKVEAIQVFRPSLDFSKHQ